MPNLGSQNLFYFSLLGGAKRTSGSKRLDSWAGNHAGNTFRTVAERTNRVSSRRVQTPQNTPTRNQHNTTTMATAATELTLSTLDNFIENVGHGIGFASLKPLQKLCLATLAKGQDVIAFLRSYFHVAPNTASFS